MKLWKKSPKKLPPGSDKKGSVILVLTATVLTLTFSAVLVLVNMSFREYKSAILESKNLQARLLARSGIEASIALLQRVSPEILYQFGAFSMPFPIVLGKGEVLLSLSEESGKLNVNRLVHFFDDEEDLLVREWFENLSVTLGIDGAIWDEVTDYIDENSVAMPSGREYAEEGMVPVKNGRLHDIRELLLLPAFSAPLLYSPLIKADQESMNFATEEEKLARQTESSVLSELLTVYLPDNPGSADSHKINVNSAGYTVLRSIHPEMTDDIARNIIIERIKAGGRFDSLDDLSAVPGILVNSGGVPLLDKLKSRLRTEDLIYKIVAEARIDSQHAHAMAVFDREAKKVTGYLD